jgi:hypothetical protein
MFTFHLGHHRRGKALLARSLRVALDLSQRRMPSYRSYLVLGTANFG